MSKRKRYDDKFRATAVVMLEAQGYPERKGALQQVADHLKMPVSTLHGWYNATRNPPPSELRSEKKGDLVALIDNEIYGILGEMPNARQDASFRDLATGFGILVDKKQLLQGKPTERIENIDKLNDAERVNRLTTILDRARQRRDRPDHSEPVQ